MDEEKALKPIIRQRLTLEEQAARLKSKMQADEQRLRELNKRIRSIERKERTHFLIQLGAITQQYLGKTDDLQQYEAFFKALETPTDTTPPQWRLSVRFDRAYQSPVIENGQKTGQMYVSQSFSTLKACFEAFRNSKWFDFTSHESTKPQK